jgi:hypothetical protein
MTAVAYTHHANLRYSEVATCASRATVVYQALFPDVSTKFAELFGEFFVEVSESMKVQCVVIVSVPTRKNARESAVAYDIDIEGLSLAVGDLALGATSVAVTLALALALAVRRRRTTGSAVAHGAIGHCATPQERLS